MFGNGPSLADIAAVTGGNRDGGFGGDGWWAIIILLALFGGFGNRGGAFGGGNCGEGCATQADVRAAVDQQTLISKMDQQTYGIADLGYAIQGQVHGVTDAITQTGFGLQQAINNGDNAISRQLADCCCENRAAIAQVRYDLANQTCELGNRIDGVSRSIHEELTAIRMEEKNERIAELTEKLGKADLAASQAAQNAYLIGQLRPSPIPAYQVANPYCCTPQTTCGCGNGYGY